MPARVAGSRRTPEPNQRNLPVLKQPIAQAGTRPSLKIALGATRAQRERPRSKRALTPRPDDPTTTRLARLMRLLAKHATQARPKPLDVERHANYDFFAGNPLKADESTRSPESRVLVTTYRLARRPTKTF